MVVECVVVTVAIVTVTAIRPGQRCCFLVDICAYKYKQNDSTMRSEFMCADVYGNMVTC